MLKMYFVMVSKHLKWILYISHEMVYPIIILWYDFLKSESEYESEINDDNCLNGHNYVRTSF